MGQTSYVYILWIAILIAGLWITMSVGSLLHAREDLAGQWELTPQTPSNGSPTVQMNVEQSGQYFNITLNPGGSLQMKMLNERQADKGLGVEKQIVLEGDQTRAVFKGRSTGDRWQLSLQGAVHGDFIAKLVDRTYPKPGTATKPAF